MSEKTKRILGEFLTDKNTAELISSIDENTRSCVTEISALCEILEMSSDESGKKYINGILSNCRKLMRQNEVITLLAEASDDQKSSCTELSGLIEEVMAGIRETTGISVVFTDKTEDDIYVKGCKTINIYLILYAVRKLLGGNFAGELEFVVSKENYEKVKISIELKSESSKKKITKSEEYFDKELPQLLCEAVNAEISAESDSSAVITLEVTEGDNKLKLSSNKIIIGRSIFSPYDVMLIEEDDETDF